MLTMKKETNFSTELDSKSSISFFRVNKDFKNLKPKKYGRDYRSFGASTTMYRRDTFDTFLPPAEI